MGEDSP
ncbi:hypothetical protein vseg_003493 [Gypsophila vaccaria]